VHTFLLEYIQYLHSCEKKLQGMMFDPFMLAQEDVNLMKGLNFDAYRFSISWSRIFPGMQTLTEL
jgi:beta-glucosidase/6-phospho-beta-glucosidase/beta-galactosidase